MHHFSSQYTCEKWIIGYNLGMDDGVKSNFGTHKELIVLKIVQYKYYVNKSRDMPHDYLAQNRKKQSSNNTFSNIRTKYF